MERKRLKWARISFIYAFIINYINSRLLHMRFYILYLTVCFHMDLYNKYSLHKFIELGKKAGGKPYFFFKEFQRQVLRNVKPELC